MKLDSYLSRSRHGVFYFRWTVASPLDRLTHAGVPEVASKALMGHSEKSVHDSYGSGPTLAMLKAAIDQIHIEHAP